MMAPVGIAGGICCAIALATKSGVIKTLLSVPAIACSSVAIAPDASLSKVITAFAILSPVTAPVAIFPDSTAAAASLTAVTAASLILAVSTAELANLAAVMMASAIMAAVMVLSLIQASDCRAVKNCSGSGVVDGVMPAARITDTRIAATKLNQAAPGRVAITPETGSPA